MIAADSKAGRVRLSASRLLGFDQALDRVGPDAIDGAEGRSAIQLAAKISIKVGGTKVAAVKAGGES